MVFFAVLGLGLFVDALVDTYSELPAGAATVSVAPGDTLWELADRVAPGSEPAAVVERIRELNGLPDGQVEAGASLVVPANS